MGLLPRAQFSQNFTTFLGLFLNTNFGNFRFTFPLFWIYRMYLSFFWIHHRVVMGLLSLGRSFCCVWYQVFWMLRARGGSRAQFFQKSATILGLLGITTCVYRSFEFTIRFEICILDFGGYSTTFLGTASTKTSCLQIFQACWSWVRVSFWCRWLCIGKAADIGSLCQRNEVAQLN